MPGAGDLDTVLVSLALTLLGYIFFSCWPGLPTCISPPTRYYFSFIFFLFCLFVSKFSIVYLPLLLLCLCLSLTPILPLSLVHSVLASVCPFGLFLIWVLSLHFPSSPPPCSDTSPSPSSIISVHYPSPIKCLFLYGLLVSQFQFCCLS